MSGEGFWQEVPVTQIGETHANKLFLRGLERILTQGEEVEVRGLKTLEIQPMVSILTEPKKRVLTVPYRRINPFFLLAEVLWLLAGKSEADFITYFNPRLKEYLDEPGKYFHGAYGERLIRSGELLQNGVSLGNINQLKVCEERLKADPHCRSAVAMIYNPLFDDVGLTKDTPCNIGISFKLREGKLNMTVFNRSNDFIWGYCSTNIVQFSVIQEVMASALGVEVGKYVQYSDSMHIYIDNPYYKRQISQSPAGKRVRQLSDQHYIWNKYDVYNWVKPLEIDGSTGLDKFLSEVKTVYSEIKAIILSEEILDREEECDNDFLAYIKKVLLIWHELKREQGEDLKAIDMIKELPLNDWTAEILRWTYNYFLKKDWEKLSIVSMLGIDELPAGLALYIKHDDGEEIL